MNTQTRIKLPQNHPIVCIFMAMTSLVMAAALLPHSADAAPITPPMPPAPPTSSSPPSTSSTPKGYNDGTGYAGRAKETQSEAAKEEAGGPQSSESSSQDSKKSKNTHHTLPPPFYISSKLVEGGGGYQCKDIPGSSDRNCSIPRGQCQGGANYSTVGGDFVATPGSGNRGTPGSDRVTVARTEVERATGLHALPVAETICATAPWILLLPGQIRPRQRLRLPSSSP